MSRCTRCSRPHENWPADDSHGHLCTDCWETQCSRWWWSACARFQEAFLQEWPTEQEVDDA